MFRALLAHPQEALNKQHLVYCMRVMSVGCGTVAVSLFVSVYAYISKFLKGFVNKHKTGVLSQNVVINGQLHFSPHYESNLIKYVLTFPGESFVFKNQHRTPAS
jgi:hypothetical protein